MVRFIVAAAFVRADIARASYSATRARNPEREPIGRWHVARDEINARLL